jgi:iron complex transport system ATP-binding protein
VSNASITTNNLSIGYDNKVVQSNLNFSLQKGEMVCVLGKNGCGKSTLLRTLAGLQPALTGSFDIQNSYTSPVRDRSSEQEIGKFQIQNSSIALVLTERLSLDNTTVHDVVAMGRYPYTSFLGGLSVEDEKVISQALADVGLADEIYTFFNDHSDGEKQRVLIAKAIAQQTPIILLDEPTAHLDLPNRIRILQLLRLLAHEQGKTILISTHELELAIQLSDRILLMSEDGVELDDAQVLRLKGAFSKAFGMDIFNPLA